MGRLVSNTVVIGGGIGGLTVAVAFARMGWRADVYESVDELRPVGKGICVPINAMQILDRLGLAASVEAAGWTLERAELRTVNNTILSRVNFSKLQEKFGQGMIAIRRSDLIKILSEALSPASLHLGHRLQSLDMTAEGATATFQGGTTATGDLLIGADGIRSIVRETILPGTAYRNSGQTCFRGICDFTLAEGMSRTSVEVWGGKYRFGYMPITADQVYWYAPVTHASGESDDLEMSSGFDRFPDPIPEIIARTPPADVIRTDLIDFPPLECWHHGRAVLLGDAAHAMTPNLGQGGGQAIEDAYILADRIRREPNLATALAQFERQRMPKVKWIVNTAWRIGQVAHWENGIARWIRDRAMAWTPERISRKSFERMFAVEDR